MSLLTDYRKRVKELLAAHDIQRVLELEGVWSVSARAIGTSRAVVAQKSLLKPSAKEVSSKPTADK